MEILALENLFYEILNAKLKSTMMQNIYSNSNGLCVSQLLNYFRIINSIAYYETEKQVIWNLGNLSYCKMYCKNSNSKPNSIQPQFVLSVSYSFLDLRPMSRFYNYYFIIKPKIIPNSIPKYLLSVRISSMLPGFCRFETKKRATYLVLFYFIVLLLLIYHIKVSVRLCC